MAKRLMCIVLSLLMIMTVLPTGVVATDSSGLPTSGAVTAGEYSLTGDVTLSGTLTISGEVTIDLCGYTITGSGSKLVFSVTDGGSLTIKDSGTGGTVDGNGQRIVSVSLDDYEDTNGASFILESGTLTNGSSSYGGAVYLYGLGSNASFTMNGGSITNCSASSQGGAVYMCENATFTMNGGSISGNSANYDKGGAVYMDGSSAVFTLSGGSVTGNTALEAGAAIYIFNGTFTMTSGTLANNYLFNTSSYEYDIASSIGYSSYKTISITGGIVSSDCITYVASGTYYKENSDGTYSVGDTTTTVYVAQVGDTKYTTISDALNAVSESGTVTLLTNISTEIDLNVSKTYTLDLGGTTVSGTIKISSGNVTLTNGTASNSSGKAVEVVASGDSDNPTTVIVDTSLTITNCTYGIYISPYDNTSGAGVNVTMNGTITNFTTAGIYVDDNITSCGDADVITVNGTISGSSGAGVAITGAENVVVSGATISGGTGIEVRAGSLTMSSGTIYSSESYTIGTSGTGVISSGYGIAIIKNNNNLAISVTVSGGTITGVASVYEKQVVSGVSTNDISIILSGGYFNEHFDTLFGGWGDADNPDPFPVVIINSGLTGFITGGYYKSDVSSYVADGYVLSGERNSASDWFVVTASVDYVAKNVTTTTSYEKLQDAIDAASKGDEIQLLESVDENITIDYTSKVTLDLAGYTLTGSITITGGDLTLDDSSEDGTGTVTGGVTVNAKVLYDILDAWDTYLLLTNGGVVSEGTYCENESDYSLYSDTVIQASIGIAGVGSFTMYNGYVEGSVTVSNGSTFTMCNGTILSGVTLGNASDVLTAVNNIVLDANGNVSSYSITNATLYNTFTMSGGTISGNTATNGGGVYVGDYATFTMTGGTISGNTASYGGGVFLGKSAKFILDGGIITANTATAVGGGVYLSTEGTFTFTSGAVYGNSATTSAADIYIDENAYSKVTLLAASEMYESSGYAWYTDDSDNRYDKDTYITTEVDVNNLQYVSYSLIAVLPGETPTLYGRTLTLDGAVGVTFYFDMGTLNAEDYTMTAFIDGPAGGRTISNIPVSSETKTIGDKTYYRFTVYVNAIEFNEEISATLYCNEGATRVATYTYSVATYCEWAISKEKDIQYVCKALLNYGDSAVEYFADGTSYNPSGWLASVTESWSEDYLNDVDVKASASSENLPTGIDSIEVSLAMSSARSDYTVLDAGVISMNFYVKLNDSSSISDYTFMINGIAVDATTTSSSNLYCVSVQVPAKNMMSTDYTLSIGDDYTISYSINQYIKATLALTTSSTDDGVLDELNDRQNLVKAMYLLGKAASDYKGWI